MKRWIALLSLALLVGWNAAATHAATILEVEGELDKEIEMTTEDILMIIPKTIAGVDIHFKVDGPAHVKVYDLKKVNGGPTLLGPAHKRVVVQPSKAGKVTVSVTTKWPNSDKPTISHYHLEVK